MQRLRLSLLLGLLLMGLFATAQAQTGPKGLPRHRQASGSGVYRLYLPAISRADAPIEATLTATASPESSATPTATGTITATGTLTATPTLTPTPTASTTATPLGSATPTATATGQPATPSATATATATPTPGTTAPTEWLPRLNYYRALAALPAATENSTWSEGGVLHSRYMVKNNTIGHTEDPANPWYTPEGLAAAQNGNVMVSSNVANPDSAAIDMWMQGPFHAIGLIDPRLESSGFGSYREADGGWQMGATLDVLRGRTGSPAPSSFPVRWPAGSGAIPLAFTGGETPDPLTSCPGYTAPTGAPFLLQLGTGSVTPSVTAHTLTRDGLPVEHCLFDESSYSNPDGPMQALARSILNGRDAIVLLPRSPLVAGALYEVTITSNGQTHSWSFTPQASAASIMRPVASLLDGQRDR